jgi:glutathione peroxidase
MFKSIKLPLALILLFILSISFSGIHHSPDQAVESIYAIKINTLEGNPIDLNSFKGKKILFVNVASECGFTPQYEDLQTLYENYKDELMVIGIPCNQFGEQEPGEADEIMEFCQNTYGVTFILTEKVDVKGDEQHPLYTWLTEKNLNGVKNSTVKWNFQKYLVDENGQLMEYFNSAIGPLNSKITDLI